MNISKYLKRTGIILIIKIKNSTIFSNNDSKDKTSEKKQLLTQNLDQKTLENEAFFLLQISSSTPPSSYNVVFVCTVDESFS